MTPPDRDTTPDRDTVEAVDGEAQTASSADDVWARMRRRLRRRAARVGEIAAVGAAGRTRQYGVGDRHPSHRRVAG